MYEMDDFNRCLYAYSPEDKRTYCYVSSVIRPDNTSDIWKIIEVGIVRRHIISVNKKNISIFEIDLTANLWFENRNRKYSLAVRLDLLDRNWFYSLKTLHEADRQLIIWSFQTYIVDEKHFFRHDRIDRGICMNDCIEKLSKLNMSSRNEYYIPKFTDALDIFNDLTLYTNAKVNREQYNEFATMCVNLELKNRYNLLAQTEILICETNFDDQMAAIG